MMSTGQDSLFFYHYFIPVFIFQIQFIKVDAMYRLLVILYIHNIL